MKENVQLSDFSLNVLPFFTTTILTVNRLQLAHRDLGVVVSSDLKWKSHYEVVLSKAYKTLGLLRRVISSALCVKAKKVLYISLVRSQLLYCSQIWRPHRLTDIRALEGVLRRATKFNLNHFQSDYRQRLSKLNTPPLMMLIEINDLNMYLSVLTILGLPLTPS